MLFGGYLRLKTTGDNFTHFIDICRKNGVSLYNVKKDENGYFFDVKAKDFKSMVTLADKCNISPLICGRFGLKMRLLAYKSRKVLIAVLLSLALFYSANSCFISEVSLVGNKIFTDSQILKCLEENGLYVGRLKFGINPKIFQNEVIKDFPEISWIWVRIDGTKAIVEVREKVSLPEFFDYKDYGNMVASRDGVIKKSISSGGTLLVSEGMYVKKGDILINGVYDSTENAPVRFVNADGMVYASTQYTAQDTFGYNIIKFKPKSKLTARYSLKLFGIELWSNKISKANTVVLPKEELKYRIFGKNYLPLAFTKTQYCEIIKKEYTLSKSEATEYAVNELVNRLRFSIPSGAEIVDTKKDVVFNSDGTFKVTVNIECIENIAIKQPIEVEEE